MGRSFSAQLREVALLGWVTKSPLGGGRLDLQVNMSFGVQYVFRHVPNAQRARTRAGGHGHPRACARGAFLHRYRTRLAGLGTEIALQL